MSPKSCLQTIDSVILSSECLSGDGAEPQARYVKYESEYSLCYDYRVNREESRSERMY